MSASVGDALREGADTSSRGWLWKDHVAAAADEIAALRAQLSAAEAETAAARRAAAAAHSDAAAAAALRARAQVADALEATLDEALAEVTAAKAQLLRLSTENEALTLELAQSELESRKLLVRLAQATAAAASDRDTAALLQGALAEATAAAQAQALREQAVVADEQASWAESRHEAKRARRAASVVAAALVRQMKAHHGLALECVTLPVASAHAADNGDDLTALWASDAGLMTAAEATALRLQLLRVPALRAASSTHLAAVVATARVVSRPFGCTFVMPSHSVPATGVVAFVASHAGLGAVTDVLVGGDVPLDWVTHALAPSLPPAHCVALTDATLFVLAPEALRALWATHPRGGPGVLAFHDDLTSTADALTAVGDVACLPAAGIEAEAARARAALAAARAALLASGAPAGDRASAGARVSVGKQASAHLATLDALLAQFQGVMDKQRA